MSHRPELVGEAISLASDGRQVGHYLDFELHSVFQPVVSVAGGKTRLEGYEGLVRPVRDGQPVSPGELFKATMPGDEFFLDWLCRKLHLRNFVKLEDKDARIFVNLDPSGFRDHALCSREVERMLARMSELGIRPEQLVCEIVEARAYDDDILVDVARKLRDNGCAIAIDDYGIRYSDVHRTRLLAPNIVKIDAGWCRRLEASPYTRDLLKSAIGRIRDFGSSLLLEGVETLKDASFAAEQSMQLLQGYLIGYPVKSPAGFSELPPLASSKTAGLGVASVA